MSRDVSALVHRGMKKGPMRDLAREVIDLGCRVRVTGHLGLLVYPPHGRPITLSLTASDARAAANARAQLRRGGLDI